MAKSVEILPAGEIRGAVVLIFLTVGNWHRGFDRLVRAVDELKGQSVIDEDVVAQVGFGEYRPANLEVMDFCSPAQFQSIAGEARIIVTHAGIGTIGEAISLGKPVIVIPRKAELGEAGDNHQRTTARQLEREGKVLAAYETSELAEKLEEARQFVPARGDGGQGILSLVEDFVADLVKRKGG